MSKSIGRDTRAEASDITGALHRAFRELPAATAATRLTNYCGRVWEILRSPGFATLYRQSLVCTDQSHVDDDPRAMLLLFLADTTALVTEGVARGEFRAVSSRSVARLIVSSLFTRAYWCEDGSEPGLRGCCSRAVAETLEVVRPALGVSMAAPPNRGTTGHRKA